MRNSLLRMPSLDHLAKEELYELYGEPLPVPIRRLDGKDPHPHAPPHAIYPMSLEMPANKIVDPEILISDYGTSFVVSEESNPSLHIPALYLPPEDFFIEPVTPGTDVWTLGVCLCEVLSERPIFETFVWDRDDIVVEMVVRCTSKCGIWAVVRRLRTVSGTLDIEVVSRITYPLLTVLHCAT